MTELLAKYFSQNATEAEKQEVLGWRSTNNKNAEEFFDYSVVWNNEEISKRAKHRSFSAVLDKIIEEPEIPSVELNPKSSSNYFKYAAVIALAILGSILLYNNITNVNKIDIVVSDKLQELVLPDGSKVFLSQNAHLTYPDKFSSEVREVSLEGRAFFEVQRNENKPFIVKTPESQIRVLGTSFLVNSDMSTHQTEVIVETGKVEVAPLSEKNNENTVQLVHGEAVKVLASSNDNLNKFENQNPNFLSWQSKTLTFQKHSLTDVFGLIEDTYGVKIIASDNQIENCDLTAIYQGKTVDSIMEIVSQTFGFGIQKVNQNTFKLTGKGCS
jgi:transmembrane sensor